MPDAHLTLAEVLTIHEQVLKASGGTPGIRDQGRLEASLMQPLATFDEQDLFPTFIEKAAALAYYISAGQPFIDGNKRTGYMAMEQILLLHEHEIAVSVNEAEAIVIAAATGKMSRETFVDWVCARVVPKV